MKSKTLTFRELKKLLRESLDDGYVQVIKIWRGYGPLCDRILVKTDTKDPQEALERAVGFIEKDNPNSKLLLDVDETEEDNEEMFDPETGHALPEFEETYHYVDATEYGASRPWYVHNENLGIVVASDKMLAKLNPDVLERLEDRGATYISDDDFIQSLMKEEGSEERNPPLTRCDICGRMFPDVDVKIIKRRVVCPKCYDEAKAAAEQRQQPADFSVKCDKCDETCELEELIFKDNTCYCPICGEEILDNEK